MPITTKSTSTPKAADKETKEPADEPAAETKAAPKAKATAITYVANQTGVTNLNGAMFTFRSGVTHVSADDPAYKAHPELFTEASDTTRPLVEQATAAPGDKR